MSLWKFARSHLFSALDAELALQRLLSVYLGKANLLPEDFYLVHKEYC